MDGDYDYDDDNDEYEIVPEEDDGLTTQQVKKKDLRTSLFIAQALLVATCVIQIGVLLYEYGYIWLMLQFKWDLTRWIPGPTVPASYVDARFLWDWWLVAVTVINVLPAILVPWTLIRPSVEGRFVLHLVLVFVAGTLTLLVWLWQVLITYVWRNNSSFHPFSPANSVDYCCKNYEGVTATTTTTIRCRNINDCVDLPTTPTIYLCTNPIFWQLIFVAMPLNLLALFGQGVANAAVRRYVRRIDDPVSVNEHVLTRRVAADVDEEDEEEGEEEDGKKRGVPAKRALTTRGSKRAIVALHVFNALYLLCVVFYLTFGVLTLDVRHTHEFPAEAPIGVRSARGSFETVVLAFTSSVIVVPVLVLFAMAARGRRAWSVVLFGIMLLVTAIHVLAFMGALQSRSTGNRPDYPNSLANHPLRCCAPDTLESTGSECDNTVLGLQCTWPVVGFPDIAGPFRSSRDVPFNPAHTTIFAFLIVFIAFDAVIAGLMFAAFLGRHRVKRVAQDIADVASQIGATAQYVFSARKGPVPPKAKTHFQAVRKRRK